MSKSGFLKKIMKDIQQLKKKHVKEIYSIKIKIYNPNTEFNKRMFRTHKYECYIHYINNCSVTVLEEDTFRDLVKRIKSHIEKFYL